MTAKAQRILVADDVDAVRESLRIALSAAGHEVAVAPDGREALERVLREPFDVLVTDLWMPEMDGLALLKRLHADRHDLRIFAMTGGGPRMTLETATSLAEIWGAEQVYLKPFDEDQLIAAIENRTA